MQRRGFLGAILAAGFAPAAIGSGVLMPVRKIVTAPALIGFSGNRLITMDMVTKEILAALEKQVAWVDRDYDEKYRAIWSGEIPTIKIRAPQSYLHRGEA